MTDSAAPLTADEVEDAIGAAMADRNFPAVVSLIKRLTVIDPHRAETVYDTIQVGMAMVRKDRG